MAFCRSGSSLKPVVYQDRLVTTAKENWEVKKTVLFGQAGGTAFAALLSGAAVPSGRLPLTWYRDPDVQVRSVKRLCMLLCPMVRYHLPRYTRENGTQIMCIFCTRRRRR
jgi:hypothetical protein